MKNKQRLWKLLKKGFNFLCLIEKQQHLELFRLNQPLTLSEKILYSHADDPKNQVNRKMYTTKNFLFKIAI
jgi:hypothetical protein